MTTGNRYGVRIENAKGKWSVLILDAEDREVGRRACADEKEARTYASTVRQHVSWLSEDRFRAYYRLPQAVS